MLVVKYENLKADLMAELRRIVDFLGYNYTESDLNCTVQSNVEQFQRKHTTDIDPFSPEQKKFVISQIQIANGLLSQYNISYPVDWLKFIFCKIVIIQMCTKEIMEYLELYFSISKIVLYILTMAGMVILCKGYCIGVIISEKG